MTVSKSMTGAKATGKVSTKGVAIKITNKKTGKIVPTATTRLGKNKSAKSPVSTAKLGLSPSRVRTVATRAAKLARGVKK